MQFDRRAFVLRSIGAVAGALVAACVRSPTASSPDVRLTARPRTPTGSITAGVHDIPVATGSNAQLYVPTRYQATRPAALFLMLHGAGASRHLIHNLYPAADARGIVVLAPRSLRQSWDLFTTGIGPDLVPLNRALDYTFNHCAIDPARVVIAGFSDGGSYALTVGSANGDLFTHVAAFSPGVFAEYGRVGKPKFFLAHGSNDEILPIENTSRVIARRLRALDYDLTYREFDGQHAIYLSIINEAFAWLS